MSNDAGSRKQRRWWPHTRLLLLWALMSASAGCALLSKPDPVVVTRFIERECPRPPKLNLDPPKPPGWWSNRLLEILENTATE